MISSLFSAFCDTLALLTESDLGLCIGALAVVAFGFAYFYRAALPEE